MTLGYSFVLGKKQKQLTYIINVFVKIAWDNLKLIGTLYSSITMSYYFYVARFDQPRYPGSISSALCAMWSGTVVLSRKVCPWFCFSEWKPVNSDSPYFPKLLVQVWILHPYSWYHTLFPQNVTLLRSREWVVGGFMHDVLVVVRSFWKHE